MLRMFGRISSDITTKVLRLSALLSEVYINYSDFVMFDKADARLQEELAITMEEISLGKETNQEFSSAIL